MTFDRLAPHYRRIEHAVFGPWLQRVRVAFLPRLGDVRRALVLGEGDGRFLAAFLRANASATVDVLDLSPRMLALARRRVGPTGRVRFHAADARTDPLPAAGYDLVVTNFFLDCFPANELAALVPKLAAALAPGGRWVVGDFRVPPGPPAVRLRSRFKLRVMYAFFRTATRLPAHELIDPAPFLTAAGLRISASARWQNGFLAADLWQRSVFPQALMPAGL